MKAPSIYPCPKCGKILAVIFPMHHCKPTPNFKRQQQQTEKFKGQTAKFTMLDEEAPLNVASTRHKRKRK